MSGVDNPMPLDGGTLNVGTVTVSGTPVVNDAILNSLNPYVYDTINVSYPDGTTERYAYLLGTTNLGTITLTYTESTKGSILSVIRT